MKSLTTGWVCRDSVCGPQTPKPILLPRKSGEGGLLFISGSAPGPFQIPDGQWKTGCRNTLRIICKIFPKQNLNNVELVTPLWVLRNKVYSSRRSNNMMAFPAARAGGTAGTCPVPRQRQQYYHPLTLAQRTSQSFALEQTSLARGIACLGVGGS